MKFGVRECCDVVLRAKSAQKIGHKIFYKNEPVCYFDTLKTSTFEGAATTVYAQGGRGNARLMSWDGERTVTFTMEDALISPIGLSILTGAGLIEASPSKPIVQHILETNPKYFREGDPATAMVVFLQNNPAIHEDNDINNLVKEPTIYLMVTDEHGDVISEPYLFRPADQADVNSAGMDGDDVITVTNGQVATTTSPYYGLYPIVLAANQKFKYESGAVEIQYDGVNDGSAIVDATGASISYKTKKIATLYQATNFIVDYYTEHTEGAMQIDITPDKFGGTFYLEASTLWRDANSGQDLPAEFIIPKCKIQSNFSFTLSSSGDPSSFTFTMDAFPDYTRFDRSEKVLARIQVLGASDTGVEEVYRAETWSKYDEKDGLVTGKKYTPGA